MPTDQETYDKVLALLQDNPNIIDSSSDQEGYKQIAEEIATQVSILKIRMNQLELRLQQMLRRQQMGIRLDI